MIGSNPQGNGRVAGVNPDSVAHAVALLRAGQIVAIPTETVYGLAADASNPDAVAAIYRAKGRPDFNPLIVHVSGVDQAQLLATFSPLAQALASAFWPGPLSLVLPLIPGASVATAVTAGLETIALRCPAHPVMRAVLVDSGLNLAAPSANRSGAISPTTAEHVHGSLGDRVPLVLDGGPCAAGLESTIVAVRAGGWQILRPGPVTEAQLTAVTGSRPLVAETAKIEAPGQLLSHYAPNKPVQLNVRTPAPDAWYIGFGDIVGDDNLSADGDLTQAAARLFGALHRADAQAKPVIAVAPIPDIGVGVAINDRLNRAATR